MRIKLHARNIDRKFSTALKVVMLRKPREAPLLLELASSIDETSLIQLLFANQSNQPQLTFLQS